MKLKDVKDSRKHAHLAFAHLECITENFEIDDEEELEQFQQKIDDLREFLFGDSCIS